jgi:hypothetical protein
MGNVVAMGGGFMRAHLGKHRRRDEVATAVSELKGRAHRWWRRVDVWASARESKVNEFVPYTRIGWYGYAPGTPPSFYHTWYLKLQGDACLVVSSH